MYIFVIVLWYLLIHTCYSQLKACYQAVDEELAGDFPCDPDADVSSCCASGNICSSNLYCVSASNGQRYVGTCTDKTWSSPACPFNLTSGNFDPWYDKFNYALNTTQCVDGTLCPFANNQSCCEKIHGIKEVHYNYTSSAVMPTDVSELTTFYAAAGYTFPTSTPSLSALLAGLSPSTKVHAAATHTPTAISVSGSSGLSPSTEVHTAAIHIPTAASVSGSSGISPSIHAVATPNLTATSVPGSSGTGHSVKIGLGIGITLSALVSVVCTILLHLSMRRRQRRQQNDVRKDLTSPMPTLVQGYSMELEGTPGGSELEDSEQVHELHDDNVHELHGDNTRSFENQF